MVDLAQLQDPNAEPPLDPQSEAFRQLVRDQLQEGQNEDDLAAQIAAVFQAQRNQRIQLWNAQQEEIRAAEEAERQIREAQEQEQRVEEEHRQEERKESEKKIPKVVEFDREAPTPRDLVIPLPSHIQEKLNKFEWLPLYWFTANASADMAASFHSLDHENTFQILQNDGEVTLRSASSSSLRKNPIADRHLTWEQYVQAYPKYMRHLMSLKIHEQHVDALGDFFTAIAHHPMANEPNGPHALLRYQENVRKNWMAAIKSPHHNSGPIYNLAILNDEEIRKCRDDINSEKLAQASKDALAAADQLKAVAQSYKDKASRLSTKDDSDSQEGSNRPSKKQRFNSFQTATNKNTTTTTQKPTYANKRSFQRNIAGLMKSDHAMQAPYGAERRLIANATGQENWSINKGKVFVSISNDQAAAQSRRDIDTNVRGVEPPSTEQACALSQRRLRAQTPLKHEAWFALLVRSGLLSKYPNVHIGLREGFITSLPSIVDTFIPPNAQSLYDHHSEFSCILQREFAAQRYIGPFSQRELFSYIGHFQTSPLSLISKPHKLNAFRLIQDFSFPHTPSATHKSINSQTNSDLFPCTWGTFNTIVRIVLSLPKGSQAAVRDVAEAYRIIPLHPSQWNATVVRISEEDSFAIDTSTAFGASPNAGVFGGVADAGADLMRSQGIGPISKWVDDHVFFRLPTKEIENYNAKREEWRTLIQKHGGLQKAGGRIWYKGETLPNGDTLEFDEDMAFPLKILTHAGDPGSSNNPSYPYSLQEVDTLSEFLGIPWQAEKDREFAESFVFTGFLWNIPEKTVAITEEKRIKYQSALREWQKSRTHVLKEVEKLHGKLLHITQVIPIGRSYLSNLEAFLALSRKSPFKPLTPPKGTTNDIEWWLTRLNDNIIRPLHHPISPEDLNAFSDASSGVGLAITLGSKWRAWKLVSGWKSDGRDIGWAEAIAFEFLIYTLVKVEGARPSVKVYGDNQGVVEGWKRGRSRNRQVNLAFRRFSQFLEAQSMEVIAAYVPSGANPADKPSRGIFPDAASLLPKIPIPEDLRHYIVDITS